jgi:hypothetical protein
MTDRPITRIVTAEQALGICRAPIVGPNQRTLLDAPAPVPDRGPSAARTLAPNQPTLVAVHSALGYSPRDARILAPDQTTMVNGIPAVIRDEPATLRLTSRPDMPRPAAVIAVPLPPPAAMLRRGQAIAFVAVACIGSALVAGGVVHLLHDRQQRATAAPTQPPPEPPIDAVLHPRR